MAFGGILLFLTVLQDPAALIEKLRSDRIEEREAAAAIDILMDGFGNREAILESGQLRIVSRREAVALWSNWWAREQRKK